MNEDTINQIGVWLVRLMLIAGAIGFFAYDKENAGGVLAFLSFIFL